MTSASLANHRLVPRRSTFNLQQITPPPSPPALPDTKSARIVHTAVIMHDKILVNRNAGGVRSPSRPLRMCSSEAPVAVADDGSSLPGGGVGGAGRRGGAAGGAKGSAAPTTLKDVSRKDRMQRMDQRRMRYKLVVGWL